MGLSGESVLVTGAGRGLGLATARRLAEDGARVWLADVRTDWLATATAKLAAEGFDVRSAAVDVADEESVTALAALVTAEGPLYGLVNNAARADGVGGKAVHEITPAEWDGLMAFGLWLLAFRAWRRAVSFLAFNFSLLSFSPRCLGRL